MNDTFTIIEEQDIILPARKMDTHKTDYGRVMIVGGSVGYAGAVKLTAWGALRAGAGLVYMAVPDLIYNPVSSAMTEAMVFPFPSDSETGCFSEDASSRIVDRALSCDVLILGPGMGRSPGCQNLSEALLREFRGSIIIDADGLYALARLDLNHFRFASSSIVVTPHYGEFIRLTHQDRIADPVAAAARYANDTGMITVLKGPETVVALANGNTFVSRKGNPGMATGGSGDVLAGIIGGFAGQFSLDQSVINGVFIHGMAGDKAAEEFGEYSMLPTDIISKVPVIIKQLAVGRRSSNE